MRFINLLREMTIFGDGLFNDLGLPDGVFNENTIPNALTIVFTIMGAISVLIITIAGLKYTMSMGEPTATAKAKDTILYAVIGLLVSIMAVAVAQFVLRRV